LIRREHGTRLARLTTFGPAVPRPILAA